MIFSLTVMAVLLIHHNTSCSEVCYIDDFLKILRNVDVELSSDVVSFENYILGCYTWRLLI